MSASACRLCGQTRGSAYVEGVCSTCRSASHYEPCTDGMANLARAIRATTFKNEGDRAKLLHLVQVADLQSRMDRKRYEALRERVMLPRFWLRDLLPSLPRFRRERPVR